jgi:hypothetical protein
MSKKHEEEKVKCKAIKDCFKSIGSSFLIFQADIKYVKTRYDKQVSGFFEIFRFMVALALVCLLIYVALVGWHFFWYDTLYSESCANAPCFTMFTRFDE